MTAVGQQHVGPEPVEDLLGQLEEDRRLPRVGRTEQLARAQGGAAGRVQVTMDRGEEQAHGIPGKKAVKRWPDRLARQGTNPLPSRSCHQQETTFRKRPQESDNVVVNSLCRDRADGLWQRTRRCPAPRRPLNWVSFTSRSTRSLCSLHGLLSAR